MREDDLEDTQLIRLDIVCCLGNMNRGDDQFRDRCVNLFEEVGTATHESIANTAEVCSIAHFLCENISWIALSVDMGDCNGAIYNPLPCDILVVLDVLVPFGCHVMAPLVAGIIVVIDKSGRCSIRDWVTF